MSEATKPKMPLRRRLLWIGGGCAVLLAVIAVAGYAWLNSASFESLVRRRLAAQLEQATGGRVEIGSFHWRLMDLEASLGGLVIHGREAANEAPYARVDEMHVRVSILNVLSPRILLRELVIRRPELHLIIYADGTTNQPRPKRASTNGRQMLNTLFDLKAGQVAVEQGLLDYDNRAAQFDAQNRHLPLDFAARDVSALLRYVPAAGKPAAAGKNPESYHVELGARDFRLTRGDAAHQSATAQAATAVEGYLQATLDVERNEAFLRSLRVTASGKGIAERTLTIAGSLDNFARPHWKATAQGELDMRLLEPLTGYANSPEGVARVDLNGEGHGGQFRVDGPIHVDGGSYVGGGVYARGVDLDAHVHADPEQLLIAQVVARLKQGGRLEGTVALDHWLPPLPGEAQLGPAAAVAPAKRHWFFSHGRKTAPVATVEATNAPITIPVNGKVTAQLKDVSIDTVMNIVGKGPFERLGVDARLNGPATATWIKGDVGTLAVGATLLLSPSAHTPAGESPATGTIDATYTQRDGAVDLRALEVAMPGSRVDAHGHLGAYPLSSPSSIAIDVRTQNLGEFDRVLRDLGLQREGKSGAAALPATLGGQAEFHGMWSGSLLDPHLAGTLTAKDVSIEAPGSTAPAQKAIHFDSIDAAGSYSAARIALDRGQFKERGAEVSVEGSLSAAAAEPALKVTGRPQFDGSSLLRARVMASKVSAAELLSALGQSLPVTGEVSAQLETDGPLRALAGSGWAELDNGEVYGEPLARVRAQGRIAGRVLQLASVTVNDVAGEASASGSYDLGSRQFTIAAQGEGVDLSRIRRLQAAGAAVNGKLGFSITGSGSVDDPRLMARGTITGLTLGSEPMGGITIDAHTANRRLIYDLTTKFESASLTAHGETALSGDFATVARMEFAKFNIAGPLKLMHIPELTGESDLAGTVTVEGPLRHWEQMRGEARLEELAVTLAGVHLHSEGPVHATLADGRVVLDPLHITGEATDVQLQGSLDLKAHRQLDMAANGSINLKLAETLDPDLTASGTTTFQVTAHGPLENPDLRGRIDFQNASLALEDLPNSLSQLHGTLEFNQNRLEVRSLTAVTGGGQLSVSGYLAYRHGIYADLAVNGKGVRIRYPEGVSSLADADLHLQGTQTNLLLSGSILITRFTLSPELDIAALASRATTVQPVASPDAPSNHVRLDVHIQSSPQLNFQNAYAKLAGDVDLRLHGTLATPSLLGRISVTEGSATIAGTRYELQRGDITFTNPVRIEPLIDLTATARVEDYDITLGLHGSPDKLAVSYRSDPPLPEADVVALLALGRTQNEQHIYGQQQEQVAASPATDALLGGALNATVSSRVQKLFGAGAVKVDPTYLGALGNSTTRITVEEQVGKNLTLTYATDVNTTAQQLLQAEIAINRHVSLLVVRDESGVFSIVVKATRRFR